MAFPASTQRLSQALDGASGAALRIKQQAQQLHATITSWAVAAAPPGLPAYAQAQWGSDQINVSAEFTAMRNAAVALRDWILSVFPKDAGTGAFLVSSYDLTTAAETPLTFSTAATAQFRTLADALTGTIG